MTSISKQQPPVAGVQVSTNPEVSSDGSKHVRFVNTVNKEPCHYTVCDIQFIISRTHLHS